jgi:hypothetical protein
LAFFFMYCRCFFKHLRVLMSLQFLLLWSNVVESMDCVLGFKVSSRILFFCLLHALQVLFWVVHDSEDMVQARLWLCHLQGYSFSNRSRLIMLTIIWLQLQYAACLARFPHCPDHLFPSVAPSYMQNCLILVSLDFLLELSSTSIWQ